MFWPIWCNERWVGLDATGPWGTYLDGYVASQLENYRNTCAYVPDHAEPASNLARVRSNVPLLAFVGGADPQDPANNIAGLGAAMPRARIVVLPEHIARMDLNIEIAGLPLLRCGRHTILGERIRPRSWLGGWHGGGWHGGRRRRLCNG